MASQYPLNPGNADPREEVDILDIYMITDPGQELLDTLHPDIPPDVPVFVEVALNGVPRGVLALAEIEHDGSNRLAVLGMRGTPGFVDIATQAAVSLARCIGLDGVVAEAMTAAHGRLYRQALRRIGGERSDG